MPSRYPRGQARSPVGRSLNNGRGTRSIQRSNYDEIADIQVILHEGRRLRSATESPEEPENFVRFFIESNEVLEQQQQSKIVRGINPSWEEQFNFSVKLGQGTWKDLQDELVVQLIQVDEQSSKPEVVVGERKYHISRFVDEPLHHGNQSNGFRRSLCALPDAGGQLRLTIDCDLPQGQGVAKIGSPKKRRGSQPETSGAVIEDNISVEFFKEEKVTISNVAGVIRRIIKAPVNGAQRQQILKFARRYQLGPRDPFELNIFRELCSELGIEAVLPENTNSVGSTRVASVETKRGDSPEKIYRNTVISTGDIVEARFGGGRRWSQGKVTFVHSNGTCDILYDDGDTEIHVEDHLVRVVSPAKAEESDTGDMIEECFQQQQRVTMGNVSSVLRKLSGKPIIGSQRKALTEFGKSRKLGPRQALDLPTFRDLCDAVGVSSGKEAVPRRNESQRRHSDATPSASPRADALQVGDPCEARFGGKSRWYAGTIKRVNRDGSYDIDYADGDFESRVDAMMVRATGGGGSRTTRPSSPRADTLQVGDPCEARFGGKSRWYAGTIKRVNRDGSYDIDYADGDFESRVDAMMVRSTGGGSRTRPSSPRADTLQVGDPCEARFGGKSRWYAGTIKRVNRDGSYDIDYADGDFESRVDAMMVRATGGGGSRTTRPSSPRADTLQVGDPCEARFGGKSRWYAGTIKRVNRDGSYDIDYADGDFESRVDAMMVRSTGGGGSRTTRPSSPRADTLQVGDPCEARFGGKSRWYAGTIKRVNRDGSYDIDYADGDFESRVDAMMVRSTGGGGSRTRPSSPRADTLQVGDPCEARFGGKSRWYAGTIKRVNRDGSYDIDYADGDFESRVDAMMVRSTGDGGSRTRPSSPRADTLQVGDPCEARFGGKSRWYAGTIKRVNRDGSYDIDYADGDFESRVDAMLVRSTGGGSRTTRPSSPRADTLQVGDPCEARFGGKSRWYAGTIKRVNRDGSYDIDYADGDFESRVDAMMVRSTGGGGSRTRPSSPRADTLQVGDPCEARFGGKSRWYAGTIKRVNRDGSYDIDYADGDFESRVDAMMVRSTGDGGSRTRPSSPRADTLQVGDPCEARFGGKSRWYAGTIKRVNRDGSYDIDYADGDFESRVDAMMVRSTGGGGSRTRPSSPRADTLQVGDPCEARFGGKSRWYAGTIKRVNRDGSYDIDYADGDFESRVDAMMVRSTGDGGSRTRPSSPRADTLQVGDPCEARFGGKSRWYAGTIKRVNRDGSYDIDYADGDFESRVDAMLVRSTGGGSRTTRPSSPRADTLQVGDPCEARFGGKSRWYAGTIKRVNRDGSYDIDYADGDFESRVDAMMVRSTGGGGSRTRPSSPRADTLQVGDPCEARFGGKSRWYAGTIKRVNRDGSYDIDYADGDFESGVDAMMVRSTGGGSRTRPSSPRADALQVGDPCEARFGGKSRWYAGTIKRVNRDGSYDIDYADGDFESRVDAMMVRSTGGGSRTTRPSSPRADTLQVGDPCEARFGGKSRWYAGTIKRVNRDGSYDIDYADGDFESRVDAMMVRSTGGGSRTRPSSPRADTLQVGDPCEARFGGKSRWYAGTIKRVNRDGSYDIDYADGDFESRVDAMMVRSTGGGSRTTRPSSPRADTLQVGDPCEARFGGKSRWYAGTIKRVNRDGSYDIDYADGDFESRVDAMMVRATGNDLNMQRIEKGSKVEARQSGSRRWASGIVTRVRNDMTYDVVFDDGSNERQMDSRNVRLMSAGQHTADFGKGQEVEARFGGKSNWYKGVVEKVHSDGTVDIAYNDGDFETYVSPNLVRPVNSSFRPGETVEARWGGEAAWYRGRITRKHSNGTYDIAYEDGDKERMVDSSLIRKLDSLSPARGVNQTSENSGISESDVRRLEYLFNKESNVTMGTIESLIRKLSGKSLQSSERRAISTFARSQGLGSRDRFTLRQFKALCQDLGVFGASSTSDTSRTSVGGAMNVGDSVEARWGGQKQWYKGTIEHVHSNGTYDISYVDGDFESRVVPELVRSIEPSRKGRRGRSQSPRLKDEKGRPNVGDVVEGRFGGGKQYYRGKITKVHRDSTFDISYDDGDKENNVPLSFIRVLQRRNSSRSRSRSPRADDKPLDDFQSGDEIEGKPEGQHKWCPGDILKCNSDGTFAVRFEDGSRVSRMRAHRIRPIDMKAPRSLRDTTFEERRRDGHSNYRSKQLKVGDRVEGQFQGGAAWYPGVITRRHRDGTLDVQCDDGDFEEYLEPSKVRIANGTNRRVRESSPRAGRRESRDDDAWEALRDLAKHEGRRVVSQRELDREKSEEDKLERLLGRQKFGALRDAFDEYDRDGSGDLSAKEVERSFLALGKRASRREIENWISDRDHDGSGTVDFVEFVKAYATIHGQHLDDSGSENDRGRNHHGDRTSRAGLKGRRRRKSRSLSDSSGSETTSRRRRARKSSSSRTGASRTAWRQEKWAQALGDRQLDAIEDSFTEWGIRRRGDRERVVQVKKIDKVFQDLDQKPEKLALMDWLQMMSLSGNDSITLPEFAHAYYCTLVDEQHDRNGTPGSYAMQLWTPSSQPLLGNRGTGNPTIASVSAQIFKYGNWKGTRQDHELLLRKLCLGKLEAQSGAIKKFVDAFETVDDDAVGLIETSRIREVLDKSDFPQSHQALSGILNRLVKQRRHISLPELLTELGFILEQAGEAYSIAAAFAKLRVHCAPKEISLLASTVIGYIDAILSRPDDGRKCVVEVSDNGLKSKVLNNVGGVELMEAVGFSPMFENKNKRNLNHARKISSRALQDGKYSGARLYGFTLQNTADRHGRTTMTAVPPETLDQLRLRRDEIEGELCVINGTEASVGQAVRELRRKHNVDQVETAVATASKLLENVLRNPSDIRQWRVRSQNPPFYRKVGHLEGHQLLMQASGFQLDDTEMMWSLKIGSEVADVNPANFRFPELSESQKSTLWRTKAELDAAVASLQVAAAGGGDAFQPTNNEGKVQDNTNDKPTKQMKPKQRTIERSSKVPIQSFRTLLSRLDFSVASSTVKLQQALLAEAFREADTNGDGFIDIDELKRLFDCTGQQSDPKTLSSWIRSRDQSGIGKVSFDAFVSSFHLFTPDPETIGDEMTTLCTALGLVRLCSTVEQFKGLLKWILDAMSTGIKRGGEGITSPRELDTQSAVFIRAVSGIPFASDLVHALGWQDSRNSNMILFDKQYVQFLEQSQALLKMHLDSLLFPQVPDLHATPLAVSLLGSPSMLEFLNSEDSGVGAKGSPLAWSVALDTLCKYFKNILEHPEDSKYRVVNTANAIFQRKIGRLGTAVHMMVAAGFRESNEGTLVFFPHPVYGSRILHARFTELKAGLPTLSRAVQSMTKETVESKEQTPVNGKQRKNQLDDSNNTNTQNETENETPNLRKHSQSRKVKRGTVDEAKVKALEDEVIKLRNQLSQTTFLASRDSTTISRMSLTEQTAMLKIAKGAGARVGPVSNRARNTKWSSSLVGNKQTLAPHQLVSSKIVQQANAGTNEIVVFSSTGFKHGICISIGNAGHQLYEELFVYEVFGNKLILDRPLLITHPKDTKINRVSVNKQQRSEFRRSVTRRIATAVLDVILHDIVIQGEERIRSSNKAVQEFEESYDRFHYNASVIHKHVKEYTEDRVVAQLLRSKVSNGCLFTGSTGDKQVKVQQLSPLQAADLRYIFDVAQSQSGDDIDPIQFCVTDIIGASLLRAELPVGEYPYPTVRRFVQELVEQRNYRGVSWCELIEVIFSFSASHLSTNDIGVMQRMELFLRFLAPSLPMSHSMRKTVSFKTLNDTWSRFKKIDSCGSGFVSLSSLIGHHDVGESNEFKVTEWARQVLGYVDEEPFLLEYPISFEQFVLYHFASNATELDCSNSTNFTTASVSSKVRNRLLVWFSREQFELKRTQVDVHEPTTVGMLELPLGSFASFIRSDADIIALLSGKTVSSAVRETWDCANKHFVFCDLDEKRSVSWSQIQSLLIDQLREAEQNFFNLIKTPIQVPGNVFAFTVNEYHGVSCAFTSDCRLVTWSSESEEASPVTLERELFQSVVDKEDRLHMMLQEQRPMLLFTETNHEYIVVNGTVFGEPILILNLFTLETVAKVPFDELGDWVRSIAVDFETATLGCLINNSDHVHIVSLSSERVERLLVTPPRRPPPRSLVCHAPGTWIASYGSYLGKWVLQPLHPSVTHEYSVAGNVLGSYLCGATHASESSNTTDLWPIVREARVLQVNSSGTLDIVYHEAKHGMHSDSVEHQVDPIRVASAHSTIERGAFIHVYSSNRVAIFVNELQVEEDTEVSWENFEQVVIETLEREVGWVPELRSQYASWSPYLNQPVDNVKLVFGSQCDDKETDEGNEDPERFHPEHVVEVTDLLFKTMKDAFHRQQSVGADYALLKQNSAIKVSVTCEEAIQSVSRPGKLACIGSFEAVALVSQGDHSIRIMNKDLKQILRVKLPSTWKTSIEDITVSESWFGKRIGGVRLSNIQCSMVRSTRAEQLEARTRKLGAAVCCFFYLCEDGVIRYLRVPSFHASFVTLDLSRVMSLLDQSTFRSVAKVGGIRYLVKYPERVRRCLFVVYQENDSTFESVVQVTCEQGFLTQGETHMVQSLSSSSGIQGVRFHRIDDDAEEQFELAANNATEHLLERTTMVTVTGRNGSIAVIEVDRSCKKVARYEQDKIEADTETTDYHWPKKKIQVRSGYLFDNYASSVFNRFEVKRLESILQELLHFATLDSNLSESHAYYGERNANSFEINADSNRMSKCFKLLQSTEYFYDSVQSSFAQVSDVFGEQIAKLSVSELLTKLSNDVSSNPIVRDRLNVLVGDGTFKGLAKQLEQVVHRNGEAASSAPLCRQHVFSAILSVFLNSARTQSIKSQLSCGRLSSDESTWLLPSVLDFDSFQTLLRKMNPFLTMSIERNNPNGDTSSNSNLSNTQFHTLCMIATRALSHIRERHAIDVHRETGTKHSKLLEVSKLSTTCTDLDALEWPSADRVTLSIPGSSSTIIMIADTEAMLKGSFSSVCNQLQLAQVGSKNHNNIERKPIMHLASLHHARDLSRKFDYIYFGPALAMSHLVDWQTLRNVTKRNGFAGSVGGCAVIRLWFAQLFLALHTLHSNGIVLGLLNLDSIAVSPTGETVKLIDLTFATAYNESQKRVVEDEEEGSKFKLSDLIDIQNPMVAPEVIHAVLKLKTVVSMDALQLEPESDVWSLGMLLLELVSGKSPKNNWNPWNEIVLEINSNNSSFLPLEPFVSEIASHERSNSQLVWKQQRNGGLLISGNGSRHTLMLNLYAQALSHGSFGATLCPSFLGQLKQAEDANHSWIDDTSKYLSDLIGKETAGNSDAVLSMAKNCASLLDVIVAACETNQSERPTAAQILGMQSFHFSDEEKLWCNQAARCYRKTCNPSTELQGLIYEPLARIENCIVHGSTSPLDDIGESVTSSAAEFVTLLDDIEKLTDCHWWGETQGFENHGIQIARQVTTSILTSDEETTDVMNRCVTIALAFATSDEGKVRLVSDQVADSKCMGSQVVEQLVETMFVIAGEMVHLTEQREQLAAYMQAATRLVLCTSDSLVETDKVNRNTFSTWNTELRKAVKPLVKGVLCCDDEDKLSELQNNFVSTRSQGVANITSIQHFHVAPTSHSSCHRKTKFSRPQTYFSGFTKMLSLVSALNDMCSETQRTNTGQVSGCKTKQAMVRHSIALLDNATCSTGFRTQLSVFDVPQVCGDSLLALDARIPELLVNVYVTSTDPGIKKSILECVKLSLLSATSQTTVIAPHQGSVARAVARRMACSQLFSAFAMDLESGDSSWVTCSLIVKVLGLACNLFGSNYIDGKFAACGLDRGLQYLSSRIQNIVNSELVQFTATSRQRARKRPVDSIVSGGTCLQELCTDFAKLLSLLSNGMLLGVISTKQIEAIHQVAGGHLEYGNESQVPKVGADTISECMHQFRSFSIDVANENYQSVANAMCCVAPVICAQLASALNRDDMEGICDLAQVNEVLPYFWGWCGRLWEVYGTEYANAWRNSDTQVFEVDLMDVELKYAHVHEALQWAVHTLDVLLYKATEFEGAALASLYIGPVNVLWRKSNLESFNDDCESFGTSSSCSSSLEFMLFLACDWKSQQTGMAERTPPILLSLQARILLVVGTRLLDAAVQLNVESSRIATGVWRLAESCRVGALLAQSNLRLKQLFQDMVASQRNSDLVRLVSIETCFNQMRGALLVLWEALLFSPWNGLHVQATKAGLPSVILIDLVGDTNSYARERVSSNQQKLAMSGLDSPTRRPRELSSPTFAEFRNRNSNSQWGPNRTSQQQVQSHVNEVDTSNVELNQYPMREHGIALLHIMADVATRMQRYQSNQTSSSIVHSVLRLAKEINLVGIERERLWQFTDRRLEILCVSLIQALTLAGPNILCEQLESIGIDAKFGTTLQDIDNEQVKWEHWGQLAACKPPTKVENRDRAQSIDNLSIRLVGDNSTINDNALGIRTSSNSNLTKYPRETISTTNDSKLVLRFEFESEFVSSTSRLPSIFADWIVGRLMVNPQELEIIHAPAKTALTSRYLDLWATAEACDVVWNSVSQQNVPLNLPDGNKLRYVYIEGRGTKEVSLVEEALPEDAIPSRKTIDQKSPRNPTKVSTAKPPRRKSIADALQVLNDDIIEVKEMFDRYCTEPVYPSGELVRTQKAMDEWKEVNAYLKDDGLESTLIQLGIHHLIPDAKEYLSHCVKQQCHFNDFVNFLAQAFPSGLPVKRDTNAMEVSNEPNLDSPPSSNLNLKTLQWLRQLFFSSDVDDDGCVSASELQVALENSVSNRALLSSETQAMVRAIDRNFQGTLSFTEFIQLYQRLCVSRNFDPHHSVSGSHEANENMSHAKVAREPNLSSHGKITDQQHQLGEYFAKLIIPGALDQELTPEVLHGLRQAFSKYDTNRDGKIDVKDLKTAFERMGRSDVSISDLKKWIQARSTGIKKDVVTFPEFAKHFSSAPVEDVPTYSSQLLEDELDAVLEAFNKYDLDRDGMISYTDLQRALYANGVEPSDDDIREWISKYDRSKRGAVSLEDFSLLVSQTHCDDVSSSNVALLQEDHDVLVENNRGSRHSNIAIAAANSIGSGDSIDSSISQIRAIFDRYDSIGRGTIQGGKVVEALKSLGWSIPGMPELVEDWLDRNDKSLRSRLGLEQFYKLIADVFQCIEPSKRLGKNRPTQDGSRVRSETKE